MKLIRLTAPLSILFCLFAGLCFAGQLPDKNDIDHLSDESLKAFNSFMAETVVERTGYEFNGAFTDQMLRQDFLLIAEKCSVKLGEIILMQQAIRKRIEEYTGLDWEQLYGVTGLWRKLVAETTASRWRKCRIDYYVAISSTGQQKTTRLAAVIKQTSDESFPKKDRRLLGVKSQWAAGGIRDFKQTAAKLDPIMSTGNFNERVYFETVLFILQISPHTNTGQIYAIAETLKNSRFMNDFELSLKLVACELKTPGEKLLKELPKTSNITGRLILDRLNANQKNSDSFLTMINSTSPFRAELAGLAALSDESSKYAELFGRLCEIEKFRRGIVFLAAAESNKKVNPAKAVDYYSRAAMKTDQFKALLPNISADRIALKGAQLGWQLYYNDTNYCPVAEKAISVYWRLSGNKTDQQMEFLYAKILNQCADAEKGRQLLQKISGDKGLYANAARLELFYDRAKNTEPKSPDAVLLKNELKLFIDTIAVKGQQEQSIKNDALDLYCKILLEEGGKENSTEVMQIIENIPQTDGFDTAGLKAAALAESGEIVKAVSVMATIADDSGCKSGVLAAALVSQVMAKIDEFEGKSASFTDFLSNCQRVANYAKCSISGAEEVAEYKKIEVELAIIKAGDDANKLAKLQSLLNEYSRGNETDIDWLRCRGRLYLKQKRFSEAFSIFQRIATARKQPGISTIRDDKWWRARYYALLSWSKLPQTKQTEVTRAIDVLLNSMKQIPSFWEEKLNELR